MMLHVCPSRREKTPGMSDIYMLVNQSVTCILQVTLPVVVTLLFHFDNR